MANPDETLFLIVVQNLNKTRQSLKDKAAAMEASSKSRIVRCPKCRTLLQEPPPGNPFYECGSCFATLQGTRSFPYKDVLDLLEA